MKLQNSEYCIEVAVVVIKQTAILFACLPAGVGDERDVRNGAVDGQEGGGPRVYRQAPSGVVVVGMETQSATQFLLGFGPL